VDQVDSDADDEDAEEEVAPPQTPPARVPIAGYELSGARIDPDDKLRALLTTIAPLGEPFVEAGPSDTVGKPLGTFPRLAQALDAIGYRAVLAAKPAGGGVVITATLTPYDRLRYVFVSGNWPLLQDEIQRRITIRPGRPIPPPGPERSAALERERGRVIDFLRGEGYFEANVRLDAVAAGPPGAVDFHVLIDRGPSYPLGPVTFTGNQALTVEDIDPMFRHADWLKLWLRPVAFTQKQLRQDIEALEKRYRELGYIGVRVTSDFSVDKSVDRNAKNVHLGVHISERKRIVVAFEGNANQSASSLKDQLTLFTRGSYDDFEAGASADAIARYYQQHGFFFARVDWRRERLSADEERLIFVIDEGPELKVRGVEFVGNRAFSGKALGDVVTVREYPPLGIGAGGYVTGRQLEQDTERVLDFYRGKGFLEAKARADAATAREALGELGAVVAGAETVSRDAKEIYVRFTIEEGPRVMLSSLTFKADDGSPLPYTNEFLLKSVALRPGHPYTPPAVRYDGRRLERLAGDAGFPSATVDPDVNRTGDQVTLTWVFKLGPRVRIGPVFVRGNFVTRPQAILEQIPMTTGDLLTTTATERGQRNLGSLQLFNNASPISFPGREDLRAGGAGLRLAKPVAGGAGPSQGPASNVAVVPMVVEVEERYEQYSVIHAGVGASTEQAPPGGTHIPIVGGSVPIGFYGRVGYENRDLAGHGWNFGSALTWGQQLLQGSVTFLDRRFFGSLFRLDASLSYLNRATVRLGDIRQGAGSIGFSREMYPGVDAGIHYNLRNTTHTEPLIRMAGPDFTISNVQLGTTVGSISANIEWLRMDNRLLPTRGFRVDASAELALPAFSVPLRPFPLDVGDDTFLKVGVHSLSVIPLGRFLFLRHGFRFDQGFPLGGASLLPKVERYFAGGDTTIRGFQLDRARVEVLRYPAIPLDPTLATAAGLYRVDYRPLGGNLRILQNIDLMFPISPPWYGSVFMDNGVVADSLDGLYPSRFRHGVGIAPLIIRLPIGDISLAWGWPLDPGPGDTRIGVFHVNVGLMF
jgi:outer membrane protein assembly factor BamA